MTKSGSKKLHCDCARAELDVESVTNQLIALWLFSQANAEEGQNQADIQNNQLL